MQISAELGIGMIAVLISVFTGVRLAGKLEGSIEQRFKSVENTLTRHEKNHVEHFRHATEDQKHHGDMEIHWTSRERERLDKVLNRIEEKLDQLFHQSRGDA